MSQITLTLKVIDLKFTNVVDNKDFNSNLKRFVKYTSGREIQSPQFEIYFCHFFTSKSTKTIETCRSNRLIDWVSEWLIEQSLSFTPYRQYFSHVTAARSNRKPIYRCLCVWQLLPACKRSFDDFKIPLGDVSHSSMPSC